jgi:FAD:protein FMN transferase
MTDFIKFFLDFKAMGSICEIVIFEKDKTVAKRAAALAALEVLRIEKKYSRYNPDSFLSQINNMAKIGSSITVDDETADLIDHSFLAFKISDRLFDITSGIFRRIWNKQITTLPTEDEISFICALVGLQKVTWKRPVLSFPLAGMEIDFGGVCKEYAADRAADICKAQGMKHGYVDLGGDFAIIGTHTDGSPHRLGIINPKGGEPVATLRIYKGGMANSGIYGKNITVDGKVVTHIINPKTGWPIYGLPAVSVVAGTCLEAGMLSTIGLLKGDEAEKWLGKHSWNHLFVRENGELGGSIKLS